MFKTFLIAKREYFAFVRTVGFWLSIVTLPLMIGAIGFVPVLLRTTAPVQTMSVAVLDLSGDNLEPALRALVNKHVTGGGGASDGAALMKKVAESVVHRDGLKLVALPAGLNSSMSVAEAEAKIPGLLAAQNAGATTVLVAYDDGGLLHFHIWSTQKQKGDLEDLIKWDLDDLQYYKMAKANGIDDKLAGDMLNTDPEIASLTPVRAGPPVDGFTGMFRDNAPRLIGALMGYMSWMTIFSSSMILLGGVIEEKSSKVLEVLLASASTEALLIGKVLGVAAVLATVGLIWSVTGFAIASYGMAFLPPDLAGKIQLALTGLFSPQQIVLLVTYFVGGYLMFGVTFAAIGAFCETQKDAQAIMGPMMIVLMVPMLCMQAAFVAPDTPIIRYLSYVPIFTPFLMPLRLAQPLPWWEIALTLFDMLLVATLMINLGRRAFKQGALTGGKLTWGTVFRLASGK